MNGNLSASLQEMREKRFTSERERLLHLEQQLIARREGINNDLRDLRRKIQALPPQEQG